MPETKTSELEKITGSTRAGLAKALNMINTNKNTKTGMFLYGPSGSGKTTVAKYLHNKLKAMNYYCRFVATPELLLEIRETFNGSGSEREVIDSYTKKVSYLFLDDFGAEKQSAFTLETLYVMLNRCESLYIPPTLVITSNFTPREIAQKMSDRIASRIAGLCEIVKLEDKDYRIEKSELFIENDANKQAREACERILQEAK